ncbi:MAG: DUF992 domain-containing protein [Pararhizobium sp.]
MLKYVLATAVSLAALTSVSSAAPLKLGDLTCQSEGGVGMIIASTKHLTCIFKSADERIPPETYSGTITNIGIDLGATGKTIMEWTVLAKNDVPYTVGSLSGSYSGVGANASFAAGLGAHLLVGGTGSSFILQPLSIQVQEGVNAAVGINTLTLRPAAG